MESSYITFSLSIIFIYLITCSNSQSIVKNLPGFPGDLPFTLETGYIGVGTNNEIQLFYYFVESLRNPSEDPLLLYLTGGPGTSGLYPFLYQIGPFSIDFDESTWDKITLVTNPESWSKTANVIYVDLPAGVGFSYATTYEASKSSDSILARHSYHFLKKWLIEHPRFLGNPLYITGISYMGMLVPIVTLETYLEWFTGSTHVFCALTPWFEFWQRIKGFALPCVDGYSVAKAPSPDLHMSGFDPETSRRNHKVEKPPTTELSPQWPEVITTLQSTMLSLEFLRKNYIFNMFDDCNLRAQTF